MFEDLGPQAGPVPQTTRPNKHAEVARNTITLKLHDEPAQHACDTRCTTEHAAKDACTIDMRVSQGLHAAHWWTRALCRHTTQQHVQLTG